ncbi:MAG: Na+/H+ antiporter NhaC [Chitinophagales bacterium]|jgi:Na+/H+ antiporter NhaC
MLYIYGIPTHLFLKVYLVLLFSFFSLLSPNLKAEGHELATDSSELLSTLPTESIDGSIETVGQLGLSYHKETQELVYKKEGVEKRFSAWFSIVPPLIAILMALLFKEVHIALILGLFFGVFSLNGFRFSNLFSSFLQIADTYIVHAIAWTEGGELQTGHLSIILFSVLIGGMVHIISSNGGMNGIVAKVSKLATSARRTQLATMLMGCLIFFDDYANSLVVGNTMRPLTDKFKISREKLAYIVDSTAAPIASVAFVTTWIGYQLSEIEKGLAVQNYVQIQESAYGIFLGSLKYAYYPLFTLFFMLLLIISKRDFGPMRKAELKSRSGEKKQSSSEENDKTSHWINAALPVLTLILMVIVGLGITGYSDEVWNGTQSTFVKLRETLSNANSYIALIWASFLACAVAVAISKLTGSLGIKKSIESLIEGFKTMVPAVVILVLAWALAGVISDLHTADFLASLVPENFNAYWLPSIFFVLSALISFATGSSWNTMAVMYPICIPIVIGVSVGNGGEVDLAYLMPVLLNTVSVILAASVFGDHCSPISDTTILSSLASECDHISHVKTQLPYALVVGSISLLCGGVLFAVGVPWYLLYLIGFVSIAGLVFLLGKKEMAYED